MKSRPAAQGTPTWQLVATGKAPYAVASADEVVIARSQGARYRRDLYDLSNLPAGTDGPSRARVHADRRHLRAGAKLAVEPGLAYVAFLKNKYDFDKVKLVSYDGGVANFLNDKQMVQQCFIFSEPLAAAKAGAGRRRFSSPTPDTTRTPA